MKTLTRVKLIHWHMFDHQTIELQGNTLVTGHNSSGKSTLLDAIQYVLTGGKTRFNVAAHAQTKRTLESYVRGKTGIEGKTYLRPGSVTAHVALELTDTIDHKRSVLGAVVDLSPEDNKKERFYHIKGSGFEDTDFLEGHTIRDAQAFISQVRTRTAITPFSTKKEFQKAVLSVFGLQHPQKYFELLAKALAFKPIDDVERFVYDFLLNEETIEIDALRNNIRRFQDLEKLIDREEEKRNDLTELIKHHDDLEKQRRYMQLYAWVILILEEAETIEKLQTTDEAIAVNTRALEHLKRSINKHNDELQTLDQDMRTADDALKSNEAYVLLERKRHDFEESQARARQLKDTVDSCVRLFKAEKRRFEAVAGATVRRIDFDTPLKQPTTALFETVIDGLEKTYRTLRGTLSRSDATLSQQIEATTENLIKVTETLKRLKARQFTYPEASARLLDTLKKSYRHRTGRDPVRIKPLCELLELDEEDEPYRNLIEGLLGPTRFVLVADPSDLQVMKSIYAEIKDKSPYAGARLADIEAFQVMPAPNALSKRLKTEDATAQTIVHHVLGAYDVVKDSHTVTTHPHTATLEPFIHEGHGIGLIDTALTRQPFIGQKALKIQIKQSESMHDQLTTSLQEYKETLNAVKIKLEHLDSTYVERLRVQVDSLDAHAQLEVKIKELHEEIKGLEKDPSWIKLDEALTRMKKKHQTVRKQCDDALHEKGRYDEKIRQLNETINHLKTVKAQKVARTNAAAVSDGALFKAARETFDKYVLEKHTASTISERVQRNRRDYELAAEKTTQELMRRMIAFNANYHFDASVRATDIDPYRAALQEVENRQLAKYRDQSRMAREQCERAFKEDFISKLKQHIDRAYEEIQRLNRALRHKRFGRDTYTFSISKAKNREFSQYHDIIRSGEDFDPNTLLSEDISDENRLIMRDLFDVLTAHADADMQEKELERYTDYRAYMSYDILITDDEGNRMRFSEVSREKSGGETQTPFYVIIASSFEQLIKQHRRAASGCLVLFDEAFNNMDESRIEAMMNFYEELNIQLLIAVPPQRMPNILAHVQTTLAVVRQGNKAYVVPYHTEKAVRQT